MEYEGRFHNGDINSINFADKQMPQSEIIRIDATNGVKTNDFVALILPGLFHKNQSQLLRLSRHGAVTLVSESDAQHQNGAAKADKRQKKAGDTGTTLDRFTRDKPGYCQRPHEA